MADSDRLSLQELTDAAGVPVRTVRYYIAEGVLPPPMGSGPASFYTANHLQRLRLIGRLKGAYLPLKEIRRRLEATPDGAVAGLLALDDAALFDPATWQRPGGDGGDAGAGTVRYIDRVLARQGPRAVREAAPIPFRAARGPAAESAAGGNDASRWDDRGGPRPARPRVVEAGEGGPPAGTPPVADVVGAGRAPGKGAGIAPAPTAAARQALDDAAAPGAEAERWRRIALGPGAELLVDEAVYERLRGRVDWLVRQARRVLG